MIASSYTDGFNWCEIDIEIDGNVWKTFYLGYTFSISSIVGVVAILINGLFLTETAWAAEEVKR